MWLNELWQRWIGGSRSARKQRRRQRTQTRRWTRLSLEPLEDRLAPASQIFGGLEFMTTGTGGSFNVGSNNVVSSTGPVAVGVAPPAGGSFTPLLLLQSGVQFTSTDATGTFTTNGAVSAYTGSTTVSLLDAHAHTFTAPGLLSTTGYYTLPSSDSNGADLAVAGGDLAVTALHFSGQELDVQGNLTLPNFPELSLAVGGSNHVALTGSGVQLTGLNETLTNTTFSEAGLSFATKGVQVQYVSATNEFDLSGSAGLTVAGNTLDVTLGTSTDPGLKIVGGALQSLDATVNGHVQIDGLTIEATNLTIQETASSNLAIMGTASIALDLGGDMQSLAVTLGMGTGTSGIVIDQATGALIGFDASITSSIQIAGLTLTTKDLTIQYESATSTTPATFAITGNATVSLALGGTPETVGLMLGSGSSKGIVIDAGNDTLTSFDAVVNSDISIDGLDVTTTGLGIRYVSATSTADSQLVIFGTASISLDVGGKTDSIGVSLGTQQDPGFVFDATTNTLESFNGALSGSINIAGLSLQANKLSIQYDPATSTSPSEFIVSGGASFALDGASVGINLGGTYSPGLVIENGQLISLQATVSGSFDLLGLTVATEKTNGLTVAYVAANSSTNTPEEFALFGGASINSSVFNFSTTLGSMSDPGISIVNGALANLNITVGGSFSLAGIVVKANGLSIQYYSAGNELELAGGIMLDFASEFEVGASIAPITPTGTEGGLLINTQTGAVSLAPGGFSITASAQLGPFAIQNLMITFSNGSNGLNFVAGGTVVLPDIGSVTLKNLDIVGGQLVGIALSEDIPIAIADTGFYLQSLTGSLININDLSNIQVSASAEVTFGEYPITIPSAGPFFAGIKDYIVDANGTVTITPTDLKLTGTVTMLGGLLGQGQANLDLNWTTGVYTATGDFKMFDDAINYMGALDINNAGDINLLATANIVVPSQIPFIGGTSIAGANFALDYSPNNTSSQDYVAAWTTVNFVTSFTIGFKIGFNGDVSAINGSDVAAIQAANTFTPLPDQPSQYYFYSQPFSAPIAPPPPGTLAPSYQITASSPILGSTYPATTVTETVSSTGFFPGPSGNFLSDYQLSHGNVILSTLNFYVIVGTYIEGVGSFDAQGNFQFTGNSYTKYTPIGATLTSSGLLQLQWSSDPGTNTSISAAYNADNAYLVLSQQTTSGNPYPLQTYSIDPVSNDPGDPVQTAQQANLMMTDNGVPGEELFVNNQDQLLYHLSQLPVNLQSVSFTLYEGSTLLGNGSFDPSGNLIFIPNGTPPITPSAASLFTDPQGDNFLALAWGGSIPLNTSVNVTYTTSDNRVIDYNLGNSASAPNGLSGQYVITMVTTSPLSQPPAFSETPLYKAPIVSFDPLFLPTVNSSGALTGTLSAQAFTPAAQNPSDTSTTVSLYYDTTGNPLGGTLFDTIDYNQFTQNAALPEPLFNFSWAGFANLPAGSYYVYAVINDGVNAPQTSALVGPVTETSPTPVLSGPASLNLTPSGVFDRGVFSAADNTALGITTNFAFPVTANLQVNGGTLTPVGGSATSNFTQQYSSAAAAVAALDGLTFTSDSSFLDLATLTFTATTNINGIAYTAVKTIPLLTPNTHLLVSQQVVDPPPSPDPNQHTLTVTVANPGGPDGQAGTNVQLQEYLSPGLVVLSSSTSQGSYDPTTGLWTIGNLPIGNTVTLSLTFEAEASTQGQLLLSTAQASSALFNYPASDAQSVLVLPNTVTEPAPTVYVTDASGTYNGKPFSATATVAGIVPGVDTTPAASLEGVTPTLTYYAGSSDNGAVLAGAPVHPGTYTVVAAFVGSFSVYSLGGGLAELVGYTSASASATFTIAQATPIIGVTDAGGTFNGQPFSATATVAGVVPGVDNTPAASLEGVTPTLTYYAGNTATGTPLAGAPASAGTYTVLAYFAGSTDYAATSFSSTFTVGQATPTVLVSDAGGTYNGQPFPATATVAGVMVGVDTTPSASLEGVTPTLAYYAGSTATGTALTGAPVNAGTYTVVASFAGSTDYVAAGTSTTFTIARAATTTAGTVPSGPVDFGQTVTLTANVSALAPSTAIPVGTVDFFDTTTQTDLGSVSLSNGTAQLLTTVPMLTGTQTITLTYEGNANFIGSSTTVTITVLPSLYVLNATAPGALTVSGDANINVSGLVQVDSSSKTALKASGNAHVTASAIDVSGGFQTTGHAAFSVTPTTGLSAPDPLAGLTPPSSAGLANEGSVHLGGHSSLTINPGIYNQIVVSGNATLTMNPGIYIIDGGGLTVSGNAHVSGAGVLIYNAGSKGITFSGNAIISLSAATTGSYAGIVLFQARDNDQPITMSGHANVSLNGAIYAANAQLILSGDAQLFASSLVVGTMLADGNSHFNEKATVHSKDSDDDRGRSEDDGHCRYDEARS